MSPQIDQKSICQIVFLCEKASLGSRVPEGEPSRWEAIGSVDLSLSNLFLLRLSMAPGFGFFHGPIDSPPTAVTFHLPPGQISATALRPDIPEAFEVIS